MQLDGRLVIVPAWVHDAVKQLGLPKSSLVNLNELAKCFSADDIISYHGVNKLFYELQQNIKLSYDELKFDSYIGLFKNIDLVKEAKTLDTIDNEYGISSERLLSNIEDGASVFLKEADGMRSLFNALTTSVYKDRAPTNPNIYVINLFHIENNTFGLMLKPYDDIVVDSNLAALDNNMELLLTHYRYEDVCQTTIFHRWCSNIKQSQQ